MTFEDLYDGYFDFVWRTLRRLGVRPADLFNVTQDVFLVVHRRLPEYEERARPTSWLFRICLHAARDHRERAHVRREVFEPSSLDRVPSEPVDPTARIEHDQELALFEAALDALELEQRAVFVLFELVGMSGADIAETLEIPLGTVYSRLRLGRETFRRAAVRERARREPALKPSTVTP